MSPIKPYALILPVIAALYGCAAPQTRRVEVSDSATREEAARQMEIAVQDMVDEQKRITRVYTQLAIKGRALCGEHVGPSVGAFLMTKPKAEMGDAFAKLYGIKDKSTVLFTLAGAPADKAGIKAQDVVLSINGILTSDKEGMGKLVDTLAPEEPIAYQVEREGKALSFSVKPERGCKYSARLSPDQIINAFADGRNIMVARGMMNFARDDNELALVLSHEMAHNTMKHIEAKKQNMTLGLIADIAGAILTRGQSSTNFAQMAANAYSQDFEAEADYVGLYIMATAGLPITDAPKFWRRMAAAHPANIKTNHAASHPSTSYRMVALEETVKEINGKLARNEPLLPNMKNGKPAAPTSK